MARLLQGHRHIRVAGSEESLFDAERSLVEVLGVAQVASGGVQRGEVVVVHAELVVDRAEHSLEDRDHPSVQRLGLIEPLLFLHQGRQRGEVRGNRDVVGAEHRFADLHRPAGVDFAVDETASGVLEATQVVPDCRRIDVVGAAGGLNDPQGPPIQRLGVVEPCRVFVHHRQVVQQRRDLDCPGAVVVFGGRDRGQYSRWAASSRPRVRCRRAELEVTVIRAGTTVSSSLWRSRIAAARR
jgi:hypothetical protein